MPLTRNEPSAGMTLYRLRDAAVIARVMQDLVQQQAVLSLYAACDESLELVADVPPLAHASVARTNVRQAALVLQVPKPASLVPQRLIGIAQLAAGVRVQCAIEGTWSEEGGGWVIHAQWPQELLQLQRRRYQRFPVPLGQNYTANFMFGKQRCALDIHDLSAGGLALRGSRTDTAMLFLGRELPQVHLKLATYDIVCAGLKVRSRRTYRSFLLGEQVLVGCSIEAMDKADQTSLDALLAAGVQMPYA